AFPDWIYNNRNIVERLWARLKEWRAVATRYENVYDLEDVRMSEERKASWLSGLKVETEEALPKICMTVRQLAEFRRQGENLPAIVTVAEPGYVPPGVQVRSWTGPNLYTANVSSQALEQVAKDPQVVSMEFSAPIGMIK
ncbi:transposase, partial [Methylobacterium sp. RAS18]|nr:transposase [Methylobacterium sp. RAS18]